MFVILLKIKYTAMEVLTQKKEIVDWTTTINNQLEKRENLSFRERFEKGLSVEEFRVEMKRRIANYPVRK
jgi:hypothetical protein